jgi:tetratricopeptide (TPR) repeat protein/cold shock CspA family protein
MADTRLADAAAAADLKEWDRAADLLSTAPQTDDVLDKRGWYLSRAKRYDEAIAAFLELRRRRPDDYRPPYMIGFQHYNQEKWQESIRWFDEALERKPDHIKSLWRKAHALEQLGDRNQAAMTAGRILRLWHELPPARQDEDRKLVGRASFLLGRQQLDRDPAGAIDLLAQAAELEPDDPYKHYKLAKALRRSGRGHEALEPAQRAHSSKRGDPNIAVELAEALYCCGRSAEAAKVLARVVRQCTSWKASQAGMLALQLGEPALARDLLQRAARDMSVRADRRVQDALAEARSKAPESDRGQRHSDGQRHGSRGRGARHRTNGSSSHGRVSMVREERGFGFLVDDEGVRRHFRFVESVQLTQGQEVEFTPIPAEKGPAAINVRPA